MSKFLSIDTETDNEDPMKANLRVVGVASSPTEAVCLSYPKDKDEIQRMLASPLPKVAHNIKYDYKVLVRHGFTINGTLEDTLIMSQMNGELKSKDRELKTLLKELFNKDHIAFKDLMISRHKNVKKALWKASNIPIKDIQDHCVDDCKSVYSLFELLREITDKECLRVYDEIEKPLLKVVLEMELKGIPVDLETVSSLITEFEEEMRISRAYCYNYYGKEFNLNASLELEDVLFNKFKYPLIKFCSNGRPATDEGTLHKLIKGGCVLTYYILEYRKLSKVIKTYLNNYKKYAVNGKIYANFQQTGTDTGRFSSSRPNLQNIHPEVLKCFTASPGNILLSFDYKQMELILLAHLSKDKMLLEAALAGRDMHDETAAQLGVDRKSAKVINFGIPYRMGAWGIRGEMKKQGIYKYLEECQELIDKHKKKFSGVEEFANQMIAMGREKGYVETLTGRKRWVTQEDENEQHFESQCVNSPIQGGCADIIKIAMINVAKYRYIPVVQVHDEVIFDVPIKEKETVIKIVTDCMQNAVKLSVPMRVEVSEGKTWEDL